MNFRCTLLLFWGLGSLGAWGQNQHLIDSLKTLAQETTIDTVRIDAYTFLMIEIMGSDTLETTRLRNLALRESQEINYYIGLSDAYFWYGFLKMQLGQMDSARWYFDKSHDASLLTEDISFIARALNQMGSTYLYESNFEKALEYYHATIKVAKDKNAPNVSASVTLNLANVFYFQGEYDAALIFYKEAAVLFDSLGQQGSNATALLNMGNAYNSLNNFPRAMECYLRSLDIHETVGDSSGVALLYGRMAGVYNDQGETDLALSYFFREKASLEQLGMIRELVNTYYNIGWVYTSKNAYPEAEVYLKLALETALETKNPSLVSYAHSGLAEIYLDLQQYDEAQVHLDHALRIRKELHLPNELAQTLNLMGKMATQQRQYDKAEKYLQEAMQIGEELEVPELMRNTASYQAELFATTGDYLKAYEAHVKFKAMDDSIRNEDNTRKIALLESEYAFEKEKEQIEAENERNSQAQLRQIQQQRYYTYAATGGLVSFLLIAFFIYRNYRQKQKANQLLAKKNDQNYHQALELQHKNQDLQELSSFKQGMTDMIAHDMKNPLNVVIGLSEGAPDQAKMKQVNQSGKLMLQLVTNMLDVQKFDQAAMKLNLAPHTLQDMLVQSKYQVELLAIARSIQFDFQVSADIHLICDREVILRVLVNLFTNGIKYSKPGGKITVKAAPIDERIQISVSDTGKGIHPEHLPHVFDKFWQSEAKHSGQMQSTGLGLTFCEIAVKAHEGTISVTSIIDQGSTFTFDLAAGSTQAIPDKKATRLSQAEFETVGQAITSIRQIPLYQFAEIEVALNQITLKSETIEQWKEAVVQAALNWDEDGFEQLLSQQEFKNS